MWLNGRVQRAYDNAVASVPGATGLIDVTLQGIGIGGLSNGTFSDHHRRSQSGSQVMKNHGHVHQGRACVLVLLLVGCVGTPIRLGSANQHLGPGDIDATTGRNIKGTGSGFQLLLFIPISINDDRSERIRNFSPSRGRLCHQYCSRRILDLGVRRDGLQDYDDATAYRRAQGRRAGTTARARRSGTGRFSVSNVRFAVAGRQG